jgi:hypothetical protein
MDVYPLVPVRPGLELVGSIGGNDEDLSSVTLHSFRSDGERRPPSSNNESLGIGMLVQPRPDSGLTRGFEDDRNVGVAGEFLVILGPLLAVVPAVGAINDESVHRLKLAAAIDGDEAAAQQRSDRAAAVLRVPLGVHRFRTLPNGSRHRSSPGD